MGKTLIPNHRFISDGQMPIIGSIENYRVASSTELNSGEFTKFTRMTSPIVNSELPTYVHSNFTAVALSKTRLLMIYADGNNSSYGTATITSIGRDSITYEDSLVFMSSAITNINAVKLNNDTVLVSFVDEGTGGYGTLIILRMVNDKLISGSPLVFTSTPIDNTCLLKISETSAIIAYEDIGNNGYGTLRKITITGLSTKATDAYIFNAALTTYISICTTERHSILIAYSNGGIPYAIKLGLNPTISVTQPIKLSDSTTSFINSACINEGLVTVSFRNGDIESANGTTCLIHVEDTGAVLVDTLVFSNTSVSYISARRLDTNKVAIIYAETGNTGYGKLSVLSYIHNKLLVTDDKYFINTPVTNLKLIDVNSSLGFIMYTDTATAVSQCMLCLISDVGIEQADSRFTVEGLAIDSAPSLKFAKIKTKTDFISTFLGAYAAESDENVSVGDFIDFVYKYKTTEYTISDSTDILSGSISTFNVTKIDEERVLLTYLNNRDPVTCIIKITGSTITVGNPIKIANNINGLSTYGTVFDENRILVAHSYDGGYVTMLTYDGITLTKGMTHKFTDTGVTVGAIYVVKIDDTHAFVPFTDNSDNYNFTAKIITVNGETLTSTSRQLNLTTAQCSNLDFGMLDDKRLLMSMYYLPVGSAGSSIGAVVLTFDAGEFVSASKFTSIESTLPRVTALEVIDKNTAIIIGPDSGPGPNKVYLLNIDDANVITVTNSIQYYSGEMYHSDLTKISENKFLLSYSDRSVNPNAFTARMLYVDADKQLILGEPFSNGVSLYLSTISLNPYKSLVVYSDTTTTNPIFKARLIGTENDIPSLTFNETVVDSVKIKPSNVSLGSDGIVTKQNDDETYDVINVSTFIDRFKTQKVVKSKVEDGRIVSGDFVTFGSTGTIETVKKTTTDNIIGLAIETGNVGEYITIRTLYK